LNKRLKSKTLLKIRDFACKVKYVHRFLGLAKTSIRRIDAKAPLRFPSKNVIKGFDFRVLFKGLFSPLKLVALLLMAIGSATLVWVGNLLWVDMSFWGKDVALALFGSRTGEAISFGIGMTVINYLILGVALFSASIMLINVQKIRGLAFRGLVIARKTRKLFLSSNAPIKLRNIRGLSLRGMTKRRMIVFAAFIVLTSFSVVNIFLLNSIIGQTATKTSLQSYGSIRTVGVGIYSNRYCIETVSTVDWGTITPGYSNSRTFYIRNEGNGDVVLSLLTSNWTPAAAENYMAVTWDYAGQSINPNQVLAVTFTLSVDSSITGIESFYFDIDIIGAS
jgi:hypothetical protein